MKVLFVSSEVFPLVKTGGLADVSGSLPTALQNLGVDIRILVPGYPSVLDQLSDLTEIANLKYLPEVDTASLKMGYMPHSKVPVMVVDAPKLYDRDGGPYIDQEGDEWHDNGMRFGVLSKVASIISSNQYQLLNWKPDLTHCNDWQTGMTPAFMRLVDKTNTKSIISLHNMAFQGCFPAELLAGLGIPQKYFVPEGLEYYGQLSFLKAGIHYADAISTVSPTYAKEIQTPAFGFSLDGLLAKRKANITGILNGIDTQEWNPEEDPHLTANYSIKKLADKAKVKAALQTRLRLNNKADAPLLGVVSRLTHQKGLDMLLPILQQHIDAGCQFALLGSGEAALESAFKQLAKRNPEKVAVTIGYNEHLSHQIMAGADIFVMPSRFEPCGLNQLYGLAYGTPPIVNKTGGLADSVINTNKSTLKQKTANGFVMQACTETALNKAIIRAIDLYKEPSTWQQIQKNGMQLDLGWDKSAAAYLALYERVIKGGKKD